MTPRPHSNVHWNDNEQTSPDCPLSCSLGRILHLLCDPAGVPGSSHGPGLLLGPARGLSSPAPPTVVLPLLCSLQAITFCPCWYLLTITTGGYVCTRLCLSFCLRLQAPWGSFCLCICLQCSRLKSLGVAGARNTRILGHTHIFVGWFIPNACDGVFSAVGIVSRSSDCTALWR